MIANAAMRMPMRIVNRERVVVVVAGAAMVIDDVCLLQ
jgi:hypothetical protein